MLQENTRPGLYTPSIPAEDVKRQYLLIEDEIHQAIDRVLPTGRYVLGPELAAFEQEFAAFCGTHYAVGVSNGTDALQLALLACGISPGDEVITVPNTYIATVFAITYVGAIPVFVDVDADTYNMNPDLLEAAITERTRAIIPVHLYGQPCEMRPILSVAHKYGLKVIEDAAHAHYVPEAAERAKRLVQRSYNAADDIRMQTDDGIRAIVECYLEINDICIPLGHYRAEEGPEHFFAYNVEYLTGRTFARGWLVGLGIQLMSQLQENDAAGIVSIMDRLGLPHSPRANELSRFDIEQALETLRERTLADERWYGIIHQRDITDDFIEHVTNSLDFA